MVDTQHLKCCDQKSCGFKSRPAHHTDIVPEITTLLRKVV